MVSNPGCPGKSRMDNNRNCMGLVICMQYKIGSVGRPRRHEKRRRGKVAEVEGKEAKVKIIENYVCFNNNFPIHLDLVIMLMYVFDRLLEMCSFYLNILDRLMNVLISTICDIICVS